jgi:hypothetical protein
VNGGREKTINPSIKNFIKSAEGKRQAVINKVATIIVERITDVREKELCALRNPEILYNQDYSNQDAEQTREELKLRYIWIDEGQEKKYQTFSVDKFGLLNESNPEQLDNLNENPQSEESRTFRNEI